MTAQEAFNGTPTMIEVDGSAVPGAFASLADEMAAIRGSTALSHRADVARFRVSGADAWEALDRLCTTDLFLRDCQLRHTLLLNESGRAIADAYVGSDDDGFLLLAEGLPRDELRAHFAAHCPAGLEAELVDLSATHDLIGLDGPFAWEVLAALEGPDVVGFPYLTLYHPRANVTYVRAGKTGEYGYSLLVPHAEAADLWQAIWKTGASMGLQEVGLHALWHAELENWFFNIHREGRHPDCSPIELQLCWRLAREDKDYVGRRALEARCVTHRLTALVGREPFRAGNAVVHGGRTIGSVLAAEISQTLGLPIGIALLELEFAHSGIDRYVAGGIPVVTGSPPFVNNLSLYVSAQRDSWATRNEVDYRGPRPLGLRSP